MGTTQTTIQWILGIFPGVKWPGRPVDTSNLVPRLRMSGAVPLLLRGEDRDSCTFFYHEFVWWCGFVAVYAPVEVNGQPYFPSALVPGKDIPVPIDQEAKRVP
jgi:hypothetical protein